MGTPIIERYPPMRERTMSNRQWAFGKYFFSSGRHIAYCLLSVAYGRKSIADWMFAMLPSPTATTFTRQKLKPYKMKFTIVLLPLIVLAASCNKETTEPNKPAATITGPWKGIAGQANVVYNRPDGTATLFAMTGSDTTMPDEKYYGRYTYANNVYSARFILPSDTFYLEMTLPTPNRLSGVYSITTGELGYAEYVRLY